MPISIVNTPNNGLKAARVRDQCFSSQQGMVARHTKSSGTTTTVLKILFRVRLDVSASVFRSTLSSRDLIISPMYLRLSWFFNVCKMNISFSLTFLGLTNNPPFLLLCYGVFWMLTRACILSLLASVLASTTGLCCCPASLSCETSMGTFFF